MDGNGRFEKASKGLVAAIEVLGDNGIELEDIIDSHTLLRSSGRATARLAMINREDSFSPIPIDNSMSALSWTELTPGRFEVLAYLS